MDRAALLAVARDGLEEHRASAIATLRATFTAYADAGAFEVEHLDGLDHAVLVRAVTASGDDLGPGAVLLPGWADRLRAHADGAPDGLPPAFRSDEGVRDAVDDWIGEVWEAAGGRDLPAPTWVRYEGDPDRFDLGSGDWL